MALTANSDVHHYPDQELRSFPVKGGAHIYTGALVGHQAGFARPLVAGDQFLGIAYKEMDNTEDSTTGTDGDVFVRVYTVGDFGFPLPGVVAADLGRPVFGTADDELVFEKHNLIRVAGHSWLGRCVDVHAQEQIILRLRTFA